ncbi:copper resistance protein CopC [Salinicoccus roseus]|jgi:methionine-rich copper-binding protein CopC|uniref:CopC domain-containing protein n=1 Tax=Lacicoccus qingdaonensis TaxID=576118 RepID=A0A1G9J5P7_9BACL|nr:MULTISPECIES: copper resistance protein CopC [Salinicoccus]MCG7333464.1 copper resistance protein CopC [Salinicoccus roseus]SDL32858.1 hypothetical protein SAMN05216216_1433 [Salinicoccus qingdaonensis]
MFGLKKIYLIIATAILFLTFPSDKVNGHSFLEEANPAEGEQLDESIDTIELSFSTKIENVSTLYLTEENNNQDIQPAAVEIEDNVMKAAFKDLLNAGTYEVNWKIVGSDGHAIEDKYSFSVSSPKDNKSQNDQNQNKDNVDEVLKDESQNNNSDNIENEPSESTSILSEQSENTDEQISLTTVIITFLIMSGVILTIGMLADKRKR